MKVLFIRLASVAGIFGLIACVAVIGTFIYPEISLSIIVWHALAAYSLIIVLMLTGSTLIEFLVIISMITILILIAQFSGGDLLSETLRLLLWNLLVAAWYLPVFVLSLGALLGLEDNDNTATNPTIDDAKEQEKQAMINKSLKRRKRKLEKRHRKKQDSH